MQLLDLTLPSPAENLALDEALLDSAEAEGEAAEYLRLWEAPQPCVVIGRSSRLASEVRVEECRRRGIPVLRRCSGGAAIVAGPGCLMYALVLSYELRPALRMLDEAHRHVLETVAGALGRHLPDIRCQGTSDLAIGNRKFSGNSLRCKRTHLLYHGTLLYDIPLGLLGQCLAMPPRQPDYRLGREHGSFVMNLPLSAAELRAALIGAWRVAGTLSDWPRELTAKLVREHYSQASWNERL